MNVKKMVILAALFLMVCGGYFAYADVYHYSDRIEVDGDPVMVSGSPWTTSQNASSNPLTDLSFWSIVTGATKVKVNTTGLWVSGGEGFEKIIFGSEDVIVCRGTSSFDDIIEQFRCTYVCDHDDTTCHDEILSAIGTGDRTVVLKSGDYNLTERIRPSSKVTNLLLSGYGATLIRQSGGNLNGMINIHCDEHHENIVIEGISLDGGGLAVDGLKLSPNITGVARDIHVYNLDGGAGIKVGKDASPMPIDITIENCILEYDSSVEGIYVDDAIDVVVKGCRVTGTSNQGIRVRDSYNVKIDDNFVSNSGTGSEPINIEGCVGVSVTSNDVSGGAYGIYSFGESVDVRVIGNNVEDTHYNGIAIYGDTTYFSVIGNFVNNTGHGGITVSPASYGTISDNIVSNVDVVDEGCIEVEYKSTHGSLASHDITITGNIVETCNWGIYIHNRDDDAAKTSYNIIIDGNTIRDASDTGLYFYDGKNISVTNNQIFGTGLRINGTASVMLDTYIDNYEYTAMPTCTAGSVFDNRYISNSSDYMCRCDIDTWKCTLFS